MWLLLDVKMVFYFSVFFSFYDKMMMIVDPLWKTTEIYLGMLYSKIHMLSAAPLYLPA